MEGHKQSTIKVITDTTCANRPRSSRPEIAGEVQRITEPCGQTQQRVKVRMINCLKASLWAMSCEPANYCASRAAREAGCCCWLWPQLDLTGCWHTVSGSRLSALLLFLEFCHIMNGCDQRRAVDSANSACYKIAQLFFFLFNFTFSRIITLWILFY
jgi:hypothetical protein